MASNQTNVIASAQALDGWLRANLGRRLTLACVSAHPTADAMLATMQGECARYQEIRLASLESSGAGMNGMGAGAVSHGQTLRWEALLRQALQQDVDALLVWCEVDAPQTQPAHEHIAQLREATRAADALNVYDHLTLALIGPGMSRAHARSLGFEEGFTLGDASAQADALTALTTLAQLILDAEAYRRRGSSPPCYL